MLETSSQPDRLAWLAQVAPSLEGSGVIYVGRWGGQRLRTVEGEAVSTGSLKGA
jgi:hypothetical protein